MKNVKKEIHFTSEGVAVAILYTSIGTFYGSASFNDEKEKGEPSEWVGCSIAENRALIAYTKEKIRLKQAELKGLKRFIKSYYTDPKTQAKAKKLLKAMNEELEELLRENEYYNDSIKAVANINKVKDDQNNDVTALNYNVGTIEAGQSKEIEILVRADGYSKKYSINDIKLNVNATAGNKKATSNYTLKVNDVITFYSTNAFFGGTPITHRIVEVLDVPETGTMFRVKGDANEEADEEKVLPSNVIGKVMFRIPSLGKVQFFLASKTGWLVAILIPALLILAYDIYKLIILISVKSKLEKYDPDKI